MAYWLGGFLLCVFGFLNSSAEMCAGSWMLDSCHFCNQFSGLWCPWVSFGMLGASTLASWGTLGQSWDDPGTILGHWRAQGRTLWGPGLDFVDFLMILGTHSESFLGIFGPKKKIYSYLFPGCFFCWFLGVNFGVWDWKTCIWHGMYCKNQLL